jgi:hypothetical protein
MVIAPGQGVPERRNEVARRAGAEHRSDSRDHRPHVAAGIAAQIDNPANQSWRVASAYLVLDRIGKGGVAGRSCIRRT